MIFQNAAIRAVTARCRMRIPVITIALAAGLSASAAAQGSNADSARAPSENDYYRLTTLPIPEGVVLEVGGLETLPDGRLGVATRRGEVWLIENPSSLNGGRPHFTRFAQGLHEALGLMYRDGALYTAQRSELTRLRDVDGDGKADRYETVYSWPLSGNYHEYSFGPVLSPTGDMIVTLNLAWVGYGESFVKWRGWMLKIAPNGDMTPIAAGFRSPSSFGYNLAGDLFYAENQGDWVGSGGISQVQSGDFMGNPMGLKWSGEPGSPVKLTKADIPDTGEPKFEVAKRVPHLNTPAVWFPHAILGISTSAILVDSTRGGFGPFAGQLFVGDEGQSKIMRVYLEKVHGVYQGVVFPFREGFVSGVFREVWGKDASMFVGQTSRGWAATGKAPYGLQRLMWTGKVPFEAHRIEARPDGFEITFTAPVDRATAGDPASYGVNSFIYKYHHIYGSPVINQVTHAIRSVVVSADGRSARLVLDSLRQGYIFEIKMAGVRSGTSTPLLHDFGYYTLNQIPADGERGTNAGDGGRGTALPVTASAVSSASSESTRTTASSVSKPAPAPVATSLGGVATKRQTTMPASWNGKADQTVAVQGVDGLKYSIAAFDVKAGSRVRLDFANVSDMLHNVVIAKPGTATRVADAALKLGLDGTRLHYVPRSDDVLFNTALLEPRKSESIYFEAPSAPGDYVFLCTFPGHSATMQGVMRVR
ncbi:MAG: plastocyanin/azurin family copper-binding protein [Gemmatimonadota bacterium]|nr:plastocyanin/azurin family copper-binding protein [Gemmatimonadota bacterium]